MPLFSRSRSLIPMTRPRTITAAAAVAVALLAAGCGSSTPATGGSDWMVKVNGNYANVYLYPANTFPGTTQRVDLGPSGFENKTTVSSAAANLGVPIANVTNVSGK